MDGETVGSSSNLGELNSFLSGSGSNGGSLISNGRGSSWNWMDSFSDAGNPVSNGMNSISHLTNSRSNLTNVSSNANDSRDSLCLLLSHFQSDRECTFGRKACFSMGCSDGMNQASSALVNQDVQIGASRSRHAAGIVFWVMFHPQLTIK